MKPKKVKEQNSLLRYPPNKSPLGPPVPGRAGDGGLKRTVVKYPQDRGKVKIKEGEGSEFTIQLPIG